MRSVRPTLAHWQALALSSGLAGTAAHAGEVEADGATPPKIYAKSWVVADAETGEVLASRNAHKQLKPASTLKTLTAVTLLPRLDKDDDLQGRVGGRRS